MAKKFEEFKFPCLVNPTGILFNPASIAITLGPDFPSIIKDDQLTVLKDEQYCHFATHSDCSRATKDELLSYISEAWQDMTRFLKSCNTVVLTWGTAWVYCLDSGFPVASCHKAPGNMFKKTLLNYESIIEQYRDLLDSTLKDKRVILTISPIRHLRDTLTLNQVSKSVLRLAAHDLTEEFSNVEYFPSYEIVLDELRDYRFYERDMLHPTDVTQEYIWERLKETYFDQNTKDFCQKWQKVLHGMRHRPLNPDSKSHRLFLENLLKTVKTFKEVETKHEQAFLREKLKAFETL
ncbi:MAG: GSCFA domain-containing protein [Pseudobacteriovorax sp.]|nr:GSCFA domain-containing protein [Pseudobacteriovorax sp.]